MSSGARSGLHRRGGGVGAADPLYAAQGRRAGLLDRAGGDRGGGGDAAGTDAASRYQDQRTHHPPHLRQPPDRHAGQNIRAHAPWR